MTLDNEAHREFLITALNAAAVQGRLQELRQFVAMADEVERAIQTAAIIKPEPGGAA